VVSSGATLVRQIGGSIGVSVFGAIFANQLARNLAGKLPAGASLPTAADPAEVKQLPPAVRAAYESAVTASLRPIFLSAAGIAVVGFAIAWLLPELRLRATAQAAGVGEGFASPRDDDALREIERSLSVLAGREQRWGLIEASPPAGWSTCLHGYWPGWASVSRSAGSGWWSNCMSTLASSPRSSSA
jgi:hypothetical protein